MSTMTSSNSKHPLRLLAELKDFFSYLTWFSQIKECAIVCWPFSQDQAYTVGLQQGNFYNIEEHVEYISRKAKKVYVMYLKCGMKYMEFKWGKENKMNLLIIKSLCRICVEVDGAMLPFLLLLNLTSPVVELVDKRCIFLAWIRKYWINDCVLIFRGMCAGGIRLCVWYGWQQCVGIDRIIINCFLK